MNLHELAIPPEARPWESYWKNRISSKLYAQMHNDCLRKGSDCSSCEIIRHMTLLIMEPEW